MFTLYGIRLPRLQRCFDAVELELESLSTSRNEFLRAIFALAYIILNLHSRISFTDVIDASTAE